MSQEKKEKNIALYGVIPLTVAQALVDVQGTAAFGQEYRILMEKKTSNQQSLVKNPPQKFVGFTP